MTNHPNRAAAYSVQHQNGKFSTVRGKSAALAAARDQVGADASVGEDDLRKHWGVKLIKLTAAQARARGV